MKFRCLLLFVSVLMSFSRAPAQSSDWQVVKNLSLGTQISLQIGNHWFAIKCHLEDVTDDELTCAQGWPLPIRAVTFARDRVRTVRIAHNTALIGLVVGAGAGTVIGLARDPIPGLGRGGTALFQGGLLALVGAGIGGIVSPAFPGRVIYRALPKPATPPGKAPTHPADTAPTTPASSSVSQKSSGEPGLSMPPLFFPTDAQFSCESL